MGRFKIKMRKHTLAMWYHLAPFEESAMVARADVETLTVVSAKVLYGSFSNHMTLTDYFRRGVYLMDFFNCILEVSVILQHLANDYINVAELIYHDCQFIIDERTNRVKFVYVKTIGAVSYISLSDLIQHYVSTALFYQEDQIDLVLSNFLAQKFTLPAIQLFISTQQKEIWKLVHKISQDYYMITPLKRCFGSTTEVSIYLKKGQPYLSVNKGEHVCVNGKKIVHQQLHHCDEIKIEDMLYHCVCEQREVYDDNCCQHYIYHSVEW